MGHISWVDKWHAVREMYNPIYKGIGYKGRLKSEFAYGAGKRTFGVADDMGHLLPKNDPRYAETKHHMRENARDIAMGYTHAGVLG